MGRVFQVGTTIKLFKAVLSKGHGLVFWKILLIRSIILLSWKFLEVCLGELILSPLLWERSYGLLPVAWLEGTKMAATHKFSRAYL